MKKILTISMKRILSLALMGIAPSLAAQALTTLPVGAEGYRVDLSWDAPISSLDPVANYSVLRANEGSTDFAEVDYVSVSQTTAVDTTMPPGATYEYEVESADAEGNLSAPSNVVSIPVPMVLEPGVLTGSTV